MMSYVWGGMILLSVVFGSLGGKAELLSKTVMESAQNAVVMSFELLGMMCFWSGLLEIARRAELTEKLARLIRPLTKRIFPGLSPESPAMAAIVMNMTANFLGLSNAATPLGLVAMKELDKLNPDKGRATDEMCMFVVINTASISLLPTTLLTLRAAAGSEDPFGIILPVWICSVSGLLVGVMAAKWMARKGRGRTR